MQEPERSWKSTKTTRLRIILEHEKIVARPTAAEHGRQQSSSGGRIRKRSSQAINQRDELRATAVGGPEPGGAGVAAQPDIGRVRFRGRALEARSRPRQRDEVKLVPADAQLVRRQHP